MSLNCAEINAVLDELDLEGAFIQQIVQSSYDTIAFHTWKAGTARTVLVCLAPGVCRIHETTRAVPKNDKPLRFMEFLRSLIKGSKITSVRQLDSDRIILWELVHAGQEFRMYMRLWSGAANIVVTDTEDAILDVFYRRPARNEVSGGRWIRPEPRKQGAEQEGVEPRVWALRDLPGQGTFNQRVDSWYAEHAGSLSREALLAEARRRWGDRINRLQTSLQKLEAKRQDFLTADRYRHQGDLLMAYLYQIPHGARTVELPDYTNEDSPLIISLDPELKPQENAARYYELYRKAVSGLANLEDDIASGRRQLEQLESELSALEAETNPLVIHKMLRRHAVPVQQRDKDRVGLTFHKDGWIILVGRNSAENDELLRRHVRGADMWLHTRDWPGGYVFIKARRGKSIPLDILLDAGNLALFYSKGRRAGTADLYYTHVKYLRRAKGAPRGTVLPTMEKNLTVTLDQGRLKNLEQSAVHRL